MKAGFRVYDTHTHIGTARHSGRVISADELLARMDAAGVDRAMVIPWPVVEDHRAAHDEIGRAVRAHGDRLAGAACLDPFIPEAAFRDEVLRCVELYCFRALKLQPQYQGLNPLSPRGDFLYETALEHRLAVIVHTGAGAPLALPSLYMMPARRFPELPLVLGHAGGGLYAAEAIVAASFCSNIYIELSSLMPHHVLEVLAHVPSTRLMIGSDLPASVETEMSKIIGLEIPDQQKWDILWNTAARLFDGEQA